MATWAFIGERGYAESMLTDQQHIVGVVLAGGQSSRMGENKAELLYHGKPLLEHMMNTLDMAGITDCYVSGYDRGYPYIPDEEKYQGPAFAIRHVMRFLKGRADKVLFVPVDMPLLSVDFVTYLLAEEQGGYFQDWPLPVLLANGDIKDEKCGSVYRFLQAQNVPELTIPNALQHCFVNTNTPEEWQEVLAQ